MIYNARQLAEILVRKNPENARSYKLRAMVIFSPHNFNLIVIFMKVNPDEPRFM